MFLQTNRINRPLPLFCLACAALFSLTGAPRPVFAAGDVVATVVNSTLVITGDEKANRIEINQLGAYLEVFGLDTQITANGDWDYYQYTENSIIFLIRKNAECEIENISIRMGGGDDDVCFPGARDRNVVFDGLVIAAMGEGRDSVSANKLQVAGCFVYSEGHLTADVQNSSFNELLVIANEQFLSKVQVGLEQRAYWGAHLSGIDNLSASQLQASHLFVETDSSTGFGTNTVTMNGLYVERDAEFTGDDGDDTFLIYNAQLDGDVRLNTDSPENTGALAADKVDIRNALIGGQLQVQSGDDRLGDTLEVRDCSINKLSFQPKDGRNDLLVKDTDISTELTFFGGNARDLVNIDGLGISSGDLRIYTGNGNDTVDLKSVRASGSMIVGLGDGNDGLAISNQSSAWFADLDGGSNSGGIDSLLFFSGQFSQTDITGFENNNAPILQTGSGVVSGRLRR